MARERMSEGLNQFMTGDDLRDMADRAGWSRLTNVRGWALVNRGYGEECWTKAGERPWRARNTAARRAKAAGATGPT